MVFQVLTNEASSTDFKGFLTLIKCSLTALGDSNFVRHISRYMVDTSRMTSSLWILKEDLNDTIPVNSKWVRLKTILSAMALQNCKSWNFVRDLKLSFNWIRPGQTLISKTLNYDKDPGIKNITIQSKHLSLSYWLIIGPLACVQPGRGRLYPG